YDVYPQLSHNPLPPVRPPTLPHLDICRRYIARIRRQQLSPYPNTWDSGRSPHRQMAWWFLDGIGCAKEYQPIGARLVLQTPADWTCPGPNTFPSDGRTQAGNYGGPLVISQDVGH